MLYNYCRKVRKSPEILRFQDFFGCGGRTRTYGLRVMRAPSGRSIDSKSLLDKAGGSYYCVEYSGEIALKSVLCAVAEHHARQPKRHIGSQTNRISEYVDGSIFVSEDLPTRAPMKRTDAHGGVMQPRPRFTIMIAAK